MLKKIDNPPILYPDGVEIADMADLWWVAHTKARNEKALAHLLCRWEIPYFLPLVEKVSHRKGRRFESLLPLFSGYVFFCGDIDARYRALTSNRIAQVLEVPDQAGLVKELIPIYQALSRGLPVDAHPYLKSGVRCRVKGGPLVGYEGIVVRKKNVTRILLQVEMLGQAAAVEIDADLLEPIG